MKAYSFKWNEKTNSMVFTDAGRHIIKFKSFGEQIAEMIKLFQRQDISIRIEFTDTWERKEKKKVSFGGTSIITKDKFNQIVEHTQGFVPNGDYMSYTFAFPLSSGKTQYIYVWYEVKHNGKCVIMYGYNREDAKPIDHTKVKFIISYKDGKD